MFSQVSVNLFTGVWVSLVAVPLGVGMPDNRSLLEGGGGITGEGVCPWGGYSPQPLPLGY